MKKMWSRPCPTNLDFLSTNYSDQVDTDLAINKYITFDREFLITQSILTDKDIV